MLTIKCDSIDPFNESLCITNRNDIIRKAFEMTNKSLLEMTIGNMGGVVSRVIVETKNMMMTMGRQANG